MMAVSIPGAVFRPVAVSFFCCLLFFAGFFSPGAAASSSASGVLKISGCSISRSGYLDALSEAFFRRTGIRILLKGGGSAAGLLNLAAGASNLAASCLPPEADNVPAGLRFTPVAQDALVFIVHPDNPVKGITMDQARAVFSGQVVNWQELGGLDLPLALYLQYSSNLPMEMGVPFTIRQELLHGAPITTNPRLVIIRPSGGLVEEAVSRDRTAIGATGFTSARRKGDRYAMLAVDGVLPTRKSIISGAYPKRFRRLLYLVSPQRPSSAATSFLGFVLSDEGQALISADGGVSLRDLP